MAAPGVRTTDLDPLAYVDELLGNTIENGEELFGRIPIAVLGALIAEGAGAINAKQVKANFAQLDAIKGTMTEGDVGLVVFDPDEELRGQYAKEGGALVRKADLTETVALAAVALAKQYRDETFEAAPSTWQALRTETLGYRNDAEGALQDALAVKADTIETKDTAVAAMMAALAVGKISDNIDTARGLVNNGEFFWVVGSDATSFKVYKRLTSATQVAATALPSAKVIDALDPLDIVRQQQPNLVSDDLNKQLSKALFQNASVTMTPATFNGRDCWAMTIKGTGLQNQVVRLPASAFGSEIAASLLVLGVNATGPGATQTASRMFVRQSNASNVEVAGTRSPEFFITPEVGNAGVPAVTEPQPVRWSGIPKHASTAWVELFIEASNTGASADRILYFADVLMATGRNPMFRLGAPAPGAANNLLPDTAWDIATSYDAGAVVKGIEDGFPTLTFVSGGTPQKSYVVPATGLLAPGRPVQALVEVLSDVSGVIIMDLIFRNAGGGEISRATAINTAAGSWQQLRAQAIVPPGTVTIQKRENWNMSLGGTYAKARRPALVAGNAGSVGLDTIIPPALRPGVSASVTFGTGGDYATPDIALDAIGGSGTLILKAGSHGPLRITPSKVRGPLVIDGEIVDGVLPVIRLATKVTGITKTPGRTKIYEAVVTGLPTLAAFQHAYQEGVADPRTVIPADERFPQHEGRTNRLMTMAQLPKPDGVATLNAALDAMDAAGPNEPGAAVDPGTNKFYFTVVGGGDGTTADIYIDAAVSFINAAADAPLRTAGTIEIRNIEVRYGGANTRPFRKTVLSGRVVMHGARVNVLDFSDLELNGFFEGSGSGSQSEFNGDILNGHGDATLAAGKGQHYLHDGRDDGISNHDKGRSHYGAAILIEHMGGCAVAPAYGADEVVENVVSNRNQKRAAWKPAAFCVIGPAADGTLETRATFRNCIDYRSRVSFGSTGGAVGEAIGCKSFGPTTYGYQNLKITDCGGTANGKLAKDCTIVETEKALAAA